MAVARRFSWVGTTEPTVVGGLVVGDYWLDTNTNPAIGRTCTVLDPVTFTRDADVHPLLNTYVSGTGTAGTDNTAQDVKTVVVPADTITQVNDRLRIRAYFIGDDGGPITATIKLNGVPISSAIDGGAADWYMTEAWLHYIDSTHANIAETGSVPATGGNSAANVAGFTWGSDQNCVVSQDQVAGNHIVVFCIFMDVFPKGLV